MRLGQVSFFSEGYGMWTGDPSAYDVLKVDVESEGLYRLNAALRQAFGERLEVTYPDYHSHLTLAYVKKGTCRQLEGNASFAGWTLHCPNFIYSTPGMTNNYVLPMPVSARPAEAQPGEPPQVPAEGVAGPAEPVAEPTEPVLEFDYNADLSRYNDAAKRKPEPKKPGKPEEKEKEKDDKADKKVAVAETSRRIVDILLDGTDSGDFKGLASFRKRTKAGVRIFAYDGARGRSFGFFSPSKTPGNVVRHDAFKTKRERDAAVNSHLRSSGAEQAHESARVEGVKLADLMLEDNVALFDTIKPGMRVTILTPQGQERSGKVVMKFSTHAVLNMGGAHGTPGIATAENVVRVSGRNQASVLRPWVSTHSE